MKKQQNNNIQKAAKTNIWMESSVQQKRKTYNFLFSTKFIQNIYYHHKDLFLLFISFAKNFFFAVLWSFFLSIRSLQTKKKDRMRENK
jgi:hypothetical protein